MSLNDLSGLSQYLQRFGTTLAHKAIATQDPLHVPGRDPLPDFSPYDREPFDAQKHCITAIAKLLNEQSAAFMIGEMGTGKTIVSMTAVDLHARQSRKQGGRGGKYRCVVICPDHLISKWCREIEDTIANAVVFRFGRWSDFLSLITRRATGRGGPSEVRHEIKHGARWVKPQGPEFYVVGRNQIKWEPSWRGCGEETHGIDKKMHSNEPSRIIKIDRKPKVDELGNTVYGPPDQWGYRQPVYKTITEKVACCPRCGNIPRNAQGVPISFTTIANKKINCEALILREKPSDRPESGLDIHNDIPDDIGRHSVRAGHELNYGGKKWDVLRCGEPLWSWTGKPYRWSPARIIKSKLRGFFDYLIVDEAHEQKSDESAQSMAMGKVLASCDKVIMMTGTFIGGYANHLFPLLMRACPDVMKELGHEWGEDFPFSQKFGRIDRIVTTSAPAEIVIGKGTRSMRRSRVGKSMERRSVRPGIMPTLFGHVVQPLAAFLTLRELADELPEFDDQILPGAVDLPVEIHAEYHRIENELAAAARKMLGHGSMKLCGTMLHTLIGYPDHPWGWEPMFEDEHAVGYWDIPKIYTKENWRGIVTPFNFDPDAIILPKERKLIEMCQQNVAEGRQVWVYCQMTQKRNVMPRLQKLLEAEGLKVGVLRSGDVDPKEREDWIIANGTKFNVMLSHPKLVSTGLDLFSKEKGGHNYSTLIFYQTGYNLFDMKQASRRAWRIGQPLDCKVVYMHYRGTMQQRALMLMSRKAAALQQLEGDTEFSEDSLAAMAGDDNAQMALVRTLSEHIDENEIARNWSKVKGSGDKKKPKADTQEQEKPAGGPRKKRTFRILDAPRELYEEADVTPPGQPTPLDSLTIGMQAVVTTMAKKAMTDEEVFAQAEAWARGGKPDLKVVRADDPPPTPEPPKPATAKPKTSMMREIDDILASLNKLVETGGEIAEEDGDEFDWANPANFDV